MSHPLAGLRVESLSLTSRMRPGWASSHRVADCGEKGKEDVALSQYPDGYADQHSHRGACSRRWHSGGPGRGGIGGRLVVSAVRSPGGRRGGSGHHHGGRLVRQEAMAGVERGSHQWKTARALAMMVGALRGLGGWGTRRLTACHGRSRISIRQPMILSEAFSGDKTCLDRMPLGSRCWQR